MPLVKVSVLQRDCELGITIEMKLDRAAIVLVADLGGDIEVGQAAGLGDCLLEDRAFLGCHPVYEISPALLRTEKCWFAGIGQWYLGIESDIYIDELTRVKRCRSGDRFSRQTGRDRREYDGGRGGNGK